MMVARVGANEKAVDLFAVAASSVVEARVAVCASCARAGSSRCVLGETERDSIAFGAFDIRTGERRPAFFRATSTRSAGDCSLSDDGKTLYLPALGEIRAVDVATGAVSTIAAPRDTRVRFATSLSNTDELLIAGINILGHGCALARLGRDPLAATPLWTSDELFVTRPMIAPNGRDIAVTAGLKSSDIWTLTPAARP